MTAITKRGTMAAASGADARFRAVAETAEVVA